MTGINDRVQGFLESWPIIEKNLNEILEEATRDGEGLFHSGGVSGSLPGESKDDLPPDMGEGNTSL
jgi:hypothetical protein